MRCEIRYGTILKHLTEKRQLVQKSDIKAIEQWMHSFDWEPEHALQVRDLALQFFDQLKPLHGLDQDARQILEAAAILHDIGFSIDEMKHHKHSHKLIRRKKLPGFSPSQQRVIANVSRYHRKAHPKTSHKSFARLNERDRDLVRRLSALLRLADGLDRSHMATVKTLECRIEGDSLVVEVHGLGEMGLDLWGAERKRALFEEVYDLKVVFTYSSR